MKGNIFRAGYFFDQCLAILVLCVEAHGASFGILAEGIDRDVVCDTIEPTGELEPSVKTIERSVCLDKNHLRKLFYLLVRGSCHATYIADDRFFETIDDQSVIIRILECFPDKLSIGEIFGHGEIIQEN